TRPPPPGFQYKARPPLGIPLTRGPPGSRSQLMSRLSSNPRWAKIALILALFAAGAAVNAQAPKAANGKKPAANKQLPFRQSAPPAKPIAPPAPRSSLLTPEAWQQSPLTQIQPGEIDRLVNRELQRDGIEAAPRTTDEQFVRRVMLDLTGQLPVPADVTEFGADRDPNKRAKLVDKLLAGDEYARHWARYWREVIAAPVTDRRGSALGRAFEEWMTTQLKENKGWGEIVRAMITAEGGCRFDDDGQNGAVFLLASHFGNDSANEQAAEVSRIFLGIQIQCAQCHDHPTDQWKRVQFHELAAYFARETPRPLR